MSEELVLAKLEQINGKINELKHMADDNRRALRGYNNTPGLVGCVSALAAEVERIRDEDIQRLEDKSNRNDAIVGIGTIIGSVIGFLFGGRP